MMTDNQVAATKKYLTIDEILAADDTTYAEAEAWGGVLRFRTLDAATMIKFSEENKTSEKTAGIRILVDSLVDADGKPIGTPAMRGQFMKKNARVISDLVGVIMRMNGFSKEGVDVSAQIKAAGGDKEKLDALVEELRGLALQIEQAGTDKTKLEAVVIAPIEKRREAEREARKNDSGKTD